MDDSLTQLIRRLDRFKSAFVSNVRNWIKKKSRGSTSSAKQLGEVRTEPVAQPQKSRHCQRSHLLFLHPFRPFESRGDPLCTILDNPHNYTQKLGQKSIIFQTLTPLTVSEDREKPRGSRVCNLPSCDFRDSFLSRFLCESVSRVIFHSSSFLVFVSVGILSRYV